MRKLGTEIHSSVNPLWFGVFSVIACYIGMVALSDPIVEEFTWEAIGILMAVGFFGWIAQEGVSKAMQVEKAGRAAPLNYLQVVIAWVADVFLFDMRVKWTAVLGTVCIVLFTLLSTIQKGFCGKNEAEEVKLGASKSPRSDSGFPSDAYKKAF